MNIATMRRLDRRAGVPLCMALTLLRRVADLRPGRRATRNPFRDGGPGRSGGPPRLLLVKLAEMGSTVLALPALQRLRARRPDVRLHYLCFQENRAVLDLLPGIEWEGVHTIRTTSAATLLGDSLGVLRRLAALMPDAAVDLEIFSRASAALVAASRAPIRVGFHRFRAEGMNCGDLFTHRLVYGGRLHTAAAFCALLEALWADPGEQPMLKAVVPAPEALPRMEPSPAETRAVRAALQREGFPAAYGPPMVILNANASDLLPLRRWPQEHFVELARRIMDAHRDCWIVLTGSPAERADIDALARRIDRPQVVSMAGRTTLREVVVLYGMARVLVTNDSGPAHFAALTPVRIVSLFGPETPDLYRPLSPGNESLTAGLACSPCIHVYNARDTVCRDNRCMQAISVEQVFRAVERAWQAG